MDNSRDYRGWEEGWGWVYGYYEQVPVGIGTPHCHIYSFNDWNLNMKHDVVYGSVSQDTGLADMNGRFVYDNDILRWARWEEELTEEPDLYFMTWDEVLGKWYLRCTRNGKEIDRSDFEDRIYGDIKNPLHDMEVIGTIWEAKRKNQDALQN